MKYIIEEAYVSFETAKLLKEKGFIENCANLYNIHTGKFEEKYVGNVFNNGQWDNYITAPTQSLVMRWLREIHKIDIDIDVYSKHSWDDSTDYWTSIFSHGHRIIVEKNEVFITYEKAVEAAIKYCLENLIQDE